MEYVMLIYNAEERWNALSEAEQEKIMAAHYAIMEQSEADGTFRAGNRLMDVAAATTVVGEEAVFGRAGHVDNVIVLHGVGMDFARLSHHDRSVDVHGITGVLHRAHHVASKHLLQTHNIALGAVWRNKCKRK